MTPVLTSCSTPRGGELGAGYWVQAAMGQMELFNRSRPIANALEDPKLPPRYRVALEEIPKIRAYVETQGLRATSSYRDFVDLKRDAVVWVVSACEPLRFEPGRWTFPIVGAFTYVGWFSREKALKMRDQLVSTGMDADVRGAAAYSTLGWFRDPVLSTMIGRDGDPFGFVETLIHESVHATLHLKSLSTLNESLAQFVAEKLTPAYLRSARGGDVARDYEASLEESRRRKALLRAAYLELEVLYASTASEADKRARKESRLEKLRKDLQWPPNRSLNNATLIQFSTYESGGEGFEHLWRACSGDLRRFLSAVKEGESHLRESKEARLDETLRSLEKGCAR